MLHCYSLCIQIVNAVPKLAIKFVAVMTDAYTKRLNIEKGHTPNKEFN